VAPVNKTDMVLFPDGLKALKQVAKKVGLNLQGAYVNLDGGFDSKHNRKLIFNAGMIPNIKENPRNRKTTKRGRKRLFNEAIHALRARVERTFAWEDKFKRLLLRFERIQQRHYGMKLMAYTLINLRAFCSPFAQSISTILNFKQLMDSFFRDKSKICVLERSNEAILTHKL
jgi:hypothetical protein